jgi:transcriptional regulator with XRE-family HTH domain
MENDRTYLSNGANTLLDAIVDRLRLKNDAALCRVLDVSPPVISKIRHGKLEIGATMLIRIHEASGLSLKDIKKYLPAGEVRPFVRPAKKYVVIGKQRSDKTTDQLADEIAQLAQEVRNSSTRGDSHANAIMRLAADLAMTMNA